MSLSVHITAEKDCSQSSVNMVFWLWEQSSGLADVDVINQDQALITVYLMVRVLVVYQVLHGSIFSIFCNVSGLETPVLFTCFPITFLCLRQVDYLISSLPTNTSQTIYMHLMVILTGNEINEVWLSHNTVQLITVTIKLKCTLCSNVS